MLSITGVPSLKGIPFRSASIFSAPRIFLHDFSAASINLNAIARKVARDRQLRVRLVRWRTVANVDSIGFVVRTCCQCSAGKS